jgi:hypothetical protein
MPGKAYLLGDKPASEIVGRMVRWIPGDIVVLFAAAINWVSAEPEKPSMKLLILFIAATPIIVVLAAFASRAVARFDFVKAALAAIAFTIWSLSVPRSGWHELELVAQNPGWVTLVSALGGLAFALFASGIERRFGAGYEP